MLKARTAFASSRREGMFFSSLVNLSADEFYQPDRLCHEVRTTMPDGAPHYTHTATRLPIEKLRKWGLATSPTTRASTCRK
jgi:hypothetical protein